MQALEIVGLGLCTLDVLIRLEACPSWSEPVRFDQMCFDGGGQTGTALCAATKLGARTGFIGTAGNDWFGEYKLQSLHEAGVDIKHVIRRNEPDNHVVLVLVDSQSGERSFNLMHNFYQNTLETQELDKAYLTQADFLITEGHHYRGDAGCCRVDACRRQKSDARWRCHHRTNLIRRKNCAHKGYRYFNLRRWFCRSAHGRVPLTGCRASSLIL